MKLSTAFALLGAASTAFPGVSAHEVAALRGFFPENFEFLGGVNCGSLATEGCGAYGPNQCDSMQTNGCGCYWDVDGSECVNDSCGSITNNNQNSYDNAIAVCESNKRDCTWNYNSNKCQNGNRNGGGTVTCNSSWNPNKCDNTAGCIYDNSGGGFCDYAECSDYDGMPSACEQWEQCYYKSNGKCKSN